MINWNANIIEAIRSQPRGDKWNEYPAQVIVIGGGGAGGGSSDQGRGGGGGGAGHLISASYIVNPISTYTITIGGGGTRPIADPFGPGLNGQPTIFSSASVDLFYALGGGGGTEAGNGADGASGGGAVGGPTFLTYYTGGLSLPVPSGSNYNTSITGSKGGNGYVGSSGGQTSWQIGGGGGGSSSPGVQSNNNSGGGGGNGTYISFISSDVAQGGAGGGCGVACNRTTANGVDGVLRGNGGAGANGQALGGLGASGSIIIAYYGEQKGIGGTVSTFGDYTVHHFTGSGTFISTGYRHDGS